MRDCKNCTHKKSKDGLSFCESWECNFEKKTDDLISRREAIKTIEGLPNCPNGFSDTYDKARIIGVLEEVPSAEPQIIRCEDCKYLVTSHIEGGYCSRNQHFVYEDDYCSCAERKTDRDCEKGW